MEYRDVIWNNCYDCDSALFDSFQYEAARLVTGASKGTSFARLCEELAWESLSTPPDYLSKLLHKLSSECTHYRLRSRENFMQFPCRPYNFDFESLFFPFAITGWISLDLDV